MSHPQIVEIFPAPEHIPDFKTPVAIVQEEEGGHKYEYMFCRWSMKWVQINPDKGLGHDLILFLKKRVGDRRPRTHAAWRHNVRIPEQSSKQHLQVSQFRALFSDESRVSKNSPLKVSFRRASFSDRFSRVKFGKRPAFEFFRFKSDGNKVCEDSLVFELCDDIIHGRYFRVVPKSVFFMVKTSSSAVWRKVFAIQKPDWTKVEDEYLDNLFIDAKYKLSKPLNERGVPRDNFFVELKFEAIRDQSELKFEAIHNQSDQTPLGLVQQIVKNKIGTSGWELIRIPEDAFELASMFWTPSYGWKLHNVLYDPPMWEWMRADAYDPVERLDLLDWPRRYSKGKEDFFEVKPYAGYAGGQNKGEPEEPRTEILCLAIFGPTFFFIMLLLFALFHLSRYVRQAVEA